MFSYIGICDFPNGDQSLRSARYFKELCASQKMDNFQLMIGVMMSYKTMTGLESKWTSVWPKKEEMADIFVDHPRAMNTLHYADYDCNTSLSHLIEAVEWGGPRLHAIQLDMIWPPDVIVKGLKRKFPNLRVVLQINANALEMVGNDPAILVEWIKKYDGSLDYVLLDKSHGKGVRMDAEVLLPFARAIADKLPNIGLAAAGGLGPSTVYLAEPLIREFPTISLDMQGKLRPSGNAMDPIDWSMAHTALLLAVAMYLK